MDPRPQNWLETSMRARSFLAISTCSNLTPRRLRTSLPSASAWANHSNYCATAKESKSKALGFRIWNLSSPTYTSRMANDETVLQLDLPGIRKVKSGKVRDIFDLGDSLLFVA